jgi:hypothetical protein
MIRDPACLRPLMRLGQQYCDDAERGEQQHDADADAERRQVLLAVVPRHPYRQRRDRVDHEREEAAAAVAQRLAAQIEHRQQSERDQHRGRRQHRPLRQAHDRPLERELRIALDVVDAPVGTDRALRLLLPRLVERLHDVIHPALALRMREEATQEQRLVRHRGHRGFAGAAVARPAHLGHHDRLVGKARREFLHALDRVRDRGLDFDAFPVRHAGARQVVGDTDDFLMRA